MTSQYVWIGIAVGVFLVGIAVGYGIFANSVQPMWNQQMFNNMMQQNPQMMHQWNQQMMNDQTGRQGMMSMMQNQEFMQQMQEAMGNQTGMGMMQ